MEGTNQSHCHFGLAWEWPYDDLFVEKLLARATAEGLTSLCMTPDEVEETSLRVAQGLTVDVYLDRASDADERFIPIQQSFEARGARIINRDPQAIWASDKATMHLEFITKGLVVPYTIILFPYAEDPRPRHLSIEKLGTPFVIKPASFGEGTFVVVDYVNVPCDMRVQSLHREGVPDQTVDRVVDKLVTEARAVVERKRGTPSLA